MGLTNGAMTYTHFLLDPLKDGEGPKERIITALNDHALGVNPKLNTPDLRVGFVHVLNPLDTVFDFQKVFHTNFLAFSYREDAKRIPAGTLKIFLKEELEKEMTARNRQRLNKAEKEEIKELLRERLLVQALPDIKVFDVLWFHQKGELLLFSSSRGVVERFRKLFRHALERDLLGRNQFTSLARLDDVPRDIESLVLALSPTKTLVPPGAGASQEEWEDGSRDQD
jgi:hypothetical protein